MPSFKAIRIDRAGDGTQVGAIRGRLVVEIG